MIGREIPNDPIQIQKQKEKVEINTTGSQESKQRQEIKSENPIPVAPQNLTEDNALQMSAIKVNVQRLTRNELAENAIVDYDAKIKEEAKTSAIVPGIETESFSELLKRMQEDTHKKSASFEMMERSISTIVSLKTKNTAARGDKSGKKSELDYRDVLSIAESVVREYKIDHARMFFLQDHAKARYKISCRLLDLILGLRKEINAAIIKDLEGDKQEAEGQKSAESTLDDIIETGAFTAAEAGKEMKDWLKNDRKYKDVLKRIVENKEELKGDREVLLKFLEDKNRLLIANQVTLSIVCDEHPELTAKLPGMKIRLRKFIDDKLKTSEETQEKIYSEVREFREFISNSLEEYREENKELIEQVNRRKDAFLKATRADSADETLWRRAELENLLMNSSISDEVFNSRVAELSNQKKENERIIDDIIDNSTYSTLLKTPLKIKIREKMGSLLIFGGELEIADMARKYYDIRGYLCPDELAAEKAVEDLRKSWRVADYLRDAFMIHIAGGGNSKAVAKMSYKELNKKARTFEGSMIRSYMIIERSGIKNKKLTPTQWKEFDAVRRFPGNYSAELLKKTLKVIEDASGTEDKISYNQFQRQANTRQSRGVGLSARILGDQFINHEELKDVLSKEEKAYLKGNVMAELFGSEEAAAFLEYSTASEIKKMAAIMRKNIIANKDKIKDLRDDDSYDKTVKLKALAKLAAAGDNVEEGTFEKFLEQEQHEFDEQVELTEELKVLRDYQNKKPVSREIRLKGEKFKAINRKFKEYEGGRYEVLGYELMRQPKYYRTIMALNPDQVDEYIKNYIDPVYKNLGEAMKKNKSGRAVMRAYFRRDFEIISSGKLTGTVMEWNRRLDAFFKTINTEDIGQGMTIEKNIEYSIRDTYNELIRRHGKKSYTIDQVYGCANFLVQLMYDDMERFSILADGKNMRGNLIAATERYEENRQKAERIFTERLKDAACPFSSEDEKSQVIRYAQFRQFAIRHLYLDTKFEENALKYIKEFEDDYRLANNIEKAPDNINEIRQDVLNRQDPALAAGLKKSYLGLSGQRIQGILNDIYAQKSLVNIGTEHNVDLSHASQNVVRDHLTHKLSARFGENLSPMLINCIVERNLMSAGMELANRTPGLSFILKKLDVEGGARVIENAQWLTLVRDALSQPDADEEPVSEDELNLMLVNVYRHDKDFIDEKTGVHNGGRKFIKDKPWYRAFRANYKELKKLEALKINDPSLEQEREGLSRDLRGLLATGLGVTDQDAKAEDSFKEIAQRAVRYITFTADFYSLIGKRLEANETYKGLNDFAKHTFTEKIRAYYNADFMADLSASKVEETGVNAAKWTEKLDDLIKDKHRMKYIKGAEMAVNSETLAMKNSNFAETMGCEAIDKVIQKYAWRGQRNKYNALSLEQKELFALALMLMDKSATGTDGGSNDVLYNPELRKKETTSRLAELTKFMAGQEYDFKIDYAQAYYKLTNYGYNSVNSLKTKLSDIAFNKALQFAEGIYKKMNAADKKDIERMEDVTSSLNEAALLGKAQNVKEADKLRKEILDYKKVKTVLLDYAKKDKESVKSSIGLTKLVPFKNRQQKKELDRIRKMTKKLTELSDANLRRLVVILQNRTLLDKSSLDGSKAINEDKREEMKLMLSDTKGEENIAGYLTNSGCYRALITALSFKIKDDSHLADKALTGGNFDSQSFNRVGLIDWQLLEDAFGIMDELDKESLARYAVGSAKDYIEYSGNEKAIAHYDVFKRDKKMERKTLEIFLRDQAAQDSQSKENKDAIIAFAGFRKLSERQKKLFFKVLGSRDLLDISKKNVYRNNWSGAAEREYVNAAGRFRLIDEYIDKSMGGNEGITLEENSFYEAMKSLLSTQVDDTVDFKSKDHAKDILAGERYYVFKRNTAVDWKLFTRALQFVNRAEYELNIREGNAELYRSAGELSKYGHMSMDYSILRRNIHSSGNQFARFGIRRTKEYLRNDILPDLSGATKTIMAISSVILPKKLLPGEREILDELFNQKKDTEFTSNIKVFNFKPVEDLEKVSDGRKKADENVITDFDKFTNKINNVLANKDIIKGGAEEVGKTLLLYIPDGYADFEYKKEKRVDIVGDQIKGYEGTFRYGDLRDDLTNFKNKYNKIKNTVGDVKDIANGVTSVFTGKKQVDRLINFTERVVIEKFTEGMYKKGNSLAGIDGAVKESYQRRKKFKFEQLKKSKLKELIKKGQLKKGDSLDPVKIANHEYWKASDEELTDADKIEATKDAAKDYFEGVLKGMFGEERYNNLKENVKIVQDFTDKIREKITWIQETAKTAQIYATSFMDIAKRVENYSALKKGKEYAGSEDVKKQDKEKLDNAKQFQTEEQQNLSAVTVSHHQDLSNIASNIAKNIQDMEVSKDVINVALQTGVVIATSAGVSGDITKKVTSAVKLGVDFALYCIRVCKDRNVLRDYYRNTEQGKEVVNGILENAKNSFGNLAENNEHIKKDHVLRLVCAGQGYEKEEELVTDTGMKLAASIAYSASDYNPVLENKIMATTVMTVLGLKGSIGKTDGATISGIFDAMKAA